MLCIVVVIDERIINTCLAVVEIDYITHED